MSLQTDRPGTSTYCPSTIHAGTVETFLGIAYQLAGQWEAVHCTKCQRVLRWASDTESPHNAAKRALGQTEPVIP